MRVLSDAERASARSHNLRDPIVVTLLAGWLQAELRNNHGVQTPIHDLCEVLSRYVAAIDTALDAAEALHAAGFRPQHIDKRH